MRHLKVKNILFFSFIFINFIMSVLIKTKLNFNYQPGEKTALLEIAPLTVWLVILCLFSLFVVFVSALCTGIFIKFFGKLESTTLETLKLYIYIIYFGIFTMINLTSILISSFIDQGLSIFTVHMINLVFYFILTCLLFLLVFKIVTVKRALVISFSIFIINSVIPLFYVFNLL